MIIFISGGVRSGKSSYAEKRAISLHCEREGSKLYYVATSRIYDDEMNERVERHQQERDRSGVHWNVLEQQENIAELLVHFQRDDVILLDCVTTLVSNELFAFSDMNEEKWHDDQFQLAVEKKIRDSFTKLAEASLNVIIVSNELSYDIPTGDLDTERYKRMIGRIHQHIVSLSKEAILVESGIPCWKKGENQCTE